jgi:hypothetical protein
MEQEEEEEEEEEEVQRARGAGRANRPEREDEDEPHHQALRELIAHHWRIFSPGSSVSYIGRCSMMLMMPSVRPQQQTTLFNSSSSLLP